MATKYAQSSGNWSAAIWYDAPTGGNAVAAPGDGDIADLNGQTVTQGTMTRIPSCRHVSWHHECRVRGDVRREHCRRDLGNRR